jgi:hypothetical protein
MKRNSFRLLVVFLGAVLFVAAASAGDLDRLVVNIPYDFVVGGNALPAGTYTVRPLSDTSKFPLSISSFEHRTAVYIIADEVEPSSHVKGSLTFVNAGDQHFLTRIQTGEHVFNLHVSAAVAQEAANQHSYLTGTSETAKH